VIDLAWSPARRPAIFSRTFHSRAETRSSPFARSRNRRPAHDRSRRRGDLSERETRGQRYVEVLRHLPELLWIRSRIARYFLRERPRVFVGIDAPDYNFTLEAGSSRPAFPPCISSAPSRSGRGGPRHPSNQGSRFAHAGGVFLSRKRSTRRRHSGHYVGHPLADVIPLNPMPSQHGRHWDWQPARSSRCCRAVV